MSEWQPIETAPKNGIKFLSWGRKGHSITRWHQPANPDAHGHWASGIHTVPPRFWMPLPAPPK